MAAIPSTDSSLQLETLSLEPNFCSKIEEGVAENSEEEAPFDYVDFNTIKSIPDSYVWNTNTDAPYKDGNLPVVDFSGATTMDIMNQVSSACQTWGVFQLINHGIPNKVFEQMEMEARKLFALPREEKLKAKRTPDNLTGFGNARYSHFFDKLMWFEDFTAYGSPRQPLDQILCSEDCDRFCAVIEDYQREVHHLALAIVDLMLSSLGLSEDDIEWFKEEKANTTAKPWLNINYYPKPPEQKAVMGAAPHTDSLLITILHQSNAPGLQVWKDDEWLTVQPMPSAVVVNVGDLFQVLSNGCFKSVLHRALVNQNQNRYSFAYFWGTQSAVSVGPHPKLLSPSNPPLYRSLSWKEYLKMKTKYYTKALDNILIKDGDMLHSL